VAAAFLTHADFRTFVLVWMASEIAGYLILLALGWWTLGARGVGPAAVFATPLRGLRTQCVGIWSFVWTTNLNTTLKMGVKELDLLIVGGLLGAAAAGIYKVARQCAKIVYEFTGPLQEALYPELAKGAAAGRAGEVRRLIGRTALLGGAVTCSMWLGFLVAGRPALRLVFGAPFLGAYEVLVWYLLALTVASASVPLSPTALSLGRPFLIFWANAIAAAIYLLLLGPCLRALGLPGAGAAYLVYYLVWASVLGLGVWRQLTVPVARRPVPLEAAVATAEAPE